MVVRPCAPTAVATAEVRCTGRSMPARIGLDEHNDQKLYQHDEGEAPGARNDTDSGPVDLAGLCRTKDLPAINVRAHALTVEPGGHVPQGSIRNLDAKNYAVPTAEPARGPQRSSRRRMRAVSRQHRRAFSASPGGATNVSSLRAFGSSWSTGHGLWESLSGLGGNRQSVVTWSSTPAGTRPGVRIASRIGV